MIKRGIIAMALLLFVAACADTASPGAQPSPTPQASSASAKATPTPSPTPGAAEVSIECYDWDTDSYVTGGPEDLDLLWPYRFDDCGEGTSTGTPSVEEQRALEMAYPKNPGVDSLSALYGICAENDKKWMGYIRTAGSPEQLRELSGALMLCPNHPQREKVARFVTVAEQNNELLEQGKVFYDGTYRVGRKVPAGTYYAQPRGKSCYWERTDASGEILDNNYSNGLRVEMTVQPSDHSVTVRGCGEWRPVGQ